MGSIVIVESPTKAKVLKKYLGKDYIVIATKGHIRDLPPHYLGLDLKNNFKPTFYFLPGKKKIVDYIKSKTATASTIYIATDPDREGEAIGWHITQVVNTFKGKYKRLLLTEITKERLYSELASPKELSMAMVNSQFARRIVDRLFGFIVSPYVSGYIKERGSAGRVQSPALKLIYERNLEIKNFQPQSFLEVTANFILDKNTPPLPAHLIKFKNSEHFPYNKNLIEEIKQTVKNSRFYIKTVRKETQKISPPPPFNTPSLLVECSKKFRWSSYQTTKLAQILYEGVKLDKEYISLITYMRTDSVRLDEKFIQNVRSFIYSSPLKDDLNPYVRKYKTKSKFVQDAHEAIRPVDITLTPHHIKNKVSTQLYKLYKLIYTRSLATQLKPSLLKKINIEIVNEDNTLTFKGQYAFIIYSGYKILYNVKSEVVPPYLEEIKEGQKIQLQTVEYKKVETKPPLPYTEGGLINKLKQLGIGRPSTYSYILHTLLKRKYIKKVKGYLHITDKGIRTIEFLLKNFGSLIEYKFTEELESELDLIEQDKKLYLEVVRNFYYKLENLKP